MLDVILQTIRGWYQLKSGDVRGLTHLPIRPASPASKPSQLDHLTFVPESFTETLAVDI